MPRNEITDMEISIAKGVVPGHRLFTKFSENINIVAVEEDIWDAGGKLSYLSVAETINLTGDAQDSPAGTGAWTIIVIGLDNNYNEVGEKITLNGVTPVPTLNQYLRVFRMVTDTAGSNGGSATNIIATAAISATVQAQIINGNNTTLMSQFTVPANHSMILTHVFGTSGEGKEVKFIGRIQDPTLANSANQIMRSSIVFQNDFALQDFQLIPQKHDFRIAAISNAAGAPASFIYRAILIHNDYMSADSIAPSPFKIAG